MVQNSETAILLKMKNCIENLFKKQILSHVSKLILQAKVEYNELLFQILVPQTSEISLARELTSKQLILFLKIYFRSLVVI